MKIVACQQGTPEWHAARAGAITASMFKVARQRVGGLSEQQQKYVDAIRRGESPDVAKEIAEYKTKPRHTDAVDRAIKGLPVGEFSESAKNYAFRLAIERISGVPLDEGFSTWQMRRGTEMEPEARAAHEAEAGVIVQQVGFVLSDCATFGASADGFIGDDGGAEYKCLVSPEGLRSVLVDNDISEFMDQIQGCMWITERKWWHFGLYCPALAPINKAFYLQEVQRDEAWIESMEADLIEFKREVDRYEKQLRASGITTN